MWNITKIAEMTGRRMVRLVCRLARDRSAATAIEYGLLAAGIGVAVLAAVFSIGEELSNFFNTQGEIIKLGTETVATM